MPEREQEPWEIVRFPAIAEADEVHDIDTIWGPQCFTRRRGEALHPTASRPKFSTVFRRTIERVREAGVMAGPGGADRDRHRLGRPPPSVGGRAR